MLISQCVARDKTYLYWASGASGTLDELRDKIGAATKFIVPSELMSKFNLARAEDLVKAPEAEFTAQAYPRLDLYRKYASAAFRQVFLESPELSCLVEAQSDGALLITLISGRGAVSTYQAKCSWRGEIADACLVCEPVVRCGEALPKSHYADVHVTCWGWSLLVLEVFLYLSAGNVTIHRYTPTAAENRAVSYSMLPYYTYRVLDLFHDKASYTSLDEIETFMQDWRRDTAQRRMQLTHGHFEENHDALDWISALSSAGKNQLLSVSTT